MGSLPITPHAASKSRLNSVAASSPRLTHRVRPRTVLTFPRGLACPLQSILTGTVVRIICDLPRVFTLACKPAIALHRSSPRRATHDGNRRPLRALATRLHPAPGRRRQPRVRPCALRRRKPAALPKCPRRHRSLRPFALDGAVRPHPAFEDAEQLVAQGVNDCKAGVAAQLWLAELASTGTIKLRNVVFTFTFKEEGAGAKTGVTLGEAFGSSLPAPPPGSTLLVLENTVRSDHPYTPLCYTAESSSYTIRLTGTLAELRAAQLALPDWRPVSIAPLTDLGGDSPGPTTPRSATFAPRPPSKIPCRTALLSADEHTLLRAGDERSHGTVPAAIGRRAATTTASLHRLTITKRGFYPARRSRRTRAVLLHAG